MEPETKIGLGVVFVVIAAIVLMMCIDTVGANRVGVKVRLGKVTGTMTPGIEWTGMFTKVYDYNLRIRKVQVDMVGPESSTDKDGQRVDGSVAVNFRLKKDPAVMISLFENVGRDSDVNYILNIEPIIREGFKQATVEYEAIEILQHRQEVKQKAIANIKANFPEEYFEIVDIVVDNIDFGDEFKAAIEAKKVASQLKLEELEMVEVVRNQQLQEIEVYKAEAEKLRLQKAQVSDLLNQQKLIDKWDGQLPQYLIITPESNGMFLNLAQGQLDNSPEPVVINEGD